MGRTSKTDLSQTDQQTLKAQVINEKGPGSILADFETLRRFVGPQGLLVSGGRHYIPLGLLADINAQMTHPLEIDLKRPLQKSYPHINALYYLLRMTGMVYLEGSGKEFRLVMDDHVNDSWQSLNLTERYFTLLETWVVRGHTEIVGEEQQSSRSPFLDSHYLLEKVGEKGAKVKGNPDLERSLPYLPGLLAVALMELFGFISVEHSRPAAGKGWSIERLGCTRFGGAMANLLTRYFGSEDFYMLAFDPRLPGFGVLQSIVRPSFPEWRSNLAAPRTIYRDGTYIFKVSLGEAKRWIAVSSSMVFEDLCLKILDAFAFDFDHLYQFQFKDRYGIRQNINHPYMESEPPSTNDVCIREAMLQPGTPMTFVYDFGDNWQFEVVLERIEPLDKKLKHAKIIKIQGKPPQQYGRW